MRTDETPLIRLEDYRVSDWLIDTVDLDVWLHPTATRVRALLAIRPNPAGLADAPLVLDGDDLTLSLLDLDGRRLGVDAYTATPQSLTIPNPPRQAFTLTIETLLDPTANTKLMGLYRSNGVYCTQCEADGFRRITYFLDRPDVMSVYTLRLEAELSEAPVLLGNGNPVAAGPVAGTNRHFAVWHDPHPKPAYLFALVGGDLAAVTRDYVTAAGDAVTLGVYVEPGKQDRADYAMEALVRSMRWDERVFGRNYDLEVFNIVAVSHFNMGAMENKGLNIFNDKYVLADPATATDQDYANIESIIAHEYFHNWTGNRITCRDWFQLCLKEGLTVFRDQEFSADERSRAVQRIEDARQIRATQFSEDAGPLAHPVRPQAYREINNFYTPTIYEKGAELIRMLKVLIGAEAFRAGMDLYFARCDGTAATIEQFLSCFAETSGQDLTHFAKWYEQAGTPAVVANGRHDATARTFTLDLAQSTPPTPGQPTKEPLVIPIRLGLTGETGDLPLHSQSPAWRGAGKGVLDLVVLDSAATQVVFTDVAEPPVLSIMRDFSAPVRLDVDLADADLLALSARDSDPFNRWQSAQTVAMRALCRAGASGVSPALDEVAVALAAALLRTLEAQGESDPAFVAQVLQLPTSADVARELGRDIDPDRIHAARLALLGGVATRLAPAIEELHVRLAPTGPFSPDAASAGRRSLRNVALALLAHGAPSVCETLAARQFDSADNLTDRLSAMTALIPLPGPTRENLLARFGEIHADEVLVLDKWFMAQASIPEDGTLDRVRAAMHHPAFSLTNPNRVRALIGAFGANLTQFNRADGAGYALMADTVIALDQANPQVAARLIGAFKSWRMLEPGRRALAESQLRRVAETPSLSRDTADIVSRALAT
jgi:aminopeptidase N